MTNIYIYSRVTKEKQKVNSDGLDALPLSNKDVIELSHVSYTLY
jgi:hypothetical protein